MRAIETMVDLPSTEAEAAVREALATQGFGVLGEIDVAAASRPGSASTVALSSSSVPATRPWATGR